MSLYRVLLILCVLFSFTSCDPEIGPGIDFGNAACSEDSEIVEILETVPVPEVKRVFMMEFTGANCANCPKGAAAVQGILDLHDETFVPIGMHTTLGGIFDPVDGAAQDFTLSEGTTYFTQFMGFGIPSASTDLFVFPQFPTEIMDPTEVSETSWIDFYDIRSELTPAVNLSVKGVINSGTLEVSAEVVYHEDSSEDHFITVYVLESHIIDKQKLPDNSTDDNYEHNHIVRQLLTTTSGSILIGPGENKVAGTKVTRNFCITEIPEVWNTENIEFAAIVHRGGASLEVLQAAKSNL